MEGIFYNDKVLSAQERMDFCAMADEVALHFSESIDGIHEIAENVASSENEGFRIIMNKLIDISTYILYCYCDIVVLTKLFIQSTNHYEKSFLRGKLKVLLNESFKKLYGFNEAAHKKSYFVRFKEVASLFPQYNRDVEILMIELNELADKGSWWKKERNAEVHIDVDLLYEYRHDDINESKVVMETEQLINVFNKIDLLLATVNRAFIDAITSEGADSEPQTQKLL